MPELAPVKLQKNHDSQRKTRIHVLHVDDDTEFLKIAKQILEIHGTIKVETSSSVEDALKLLETKSFDVIISDYQMPQKSGLYLLKELRENENKTPFILFTGKGRKEVAIEALNLGADYYVNKLGDPGTVYGELDHFINQAMEKSKTSVLLKESEEKYRNLFENADVGILLLDLNGKVVSVNKTALNLGFISNSTIGMSVTDFVSHENVPLLLQDIENVRKGNVARRKIELNSINGNVIADYKANPIIVDNKVVGIQAIVNDITESEQMEQALKRSETKYHKLFDEAMDAIFLADPETGIIVDCNIAATKLVGRTKSELIGAHQRILHPPEESEGEFTEVFKKHCNQKNKTITEERIITKNGEIRDVLIKASEIEIDNKRMLQGTFRDITGQKRAENLVKESEERFRELTELLPETVFETDMTGKLRFVNKKGFEKFGYTPDDMENEISTLNLLSPKDREISKKRIARVLQGETLGPNEYTALRKDGTTFPIIIHSAPILQGKKVTGIRGVIVDITELKKAEVAIHKEKELLEMVTANNAAILVVISRDYRVLWANKQLKTIFGDLEGKSCYTSLPLRTSKCPNCGIDEILATGTNRAVHEHTIIDGNGNWHCFEITAVPILDSNGDLKAVSETILEITDRKMAEQALKDSEEKFRAISTAAKEGIVLLDENARVVYWNPATERILGYSEEEVVGKKITEILLPEHMQEKTTKEFNALKKEDQNSPTLIAQELLVLNSSKKMIPIEVSVSTLKLKGKWHALITVRDMSEQKAAWESLEQTMSALVVVNEKLGVVGKLTRHDARNKLSVILNNLYLAKKHMNGCENAKPFCDGVKEAVNQIEKIFEFTRTYEMLGVEELTPINVGTSVSNASLLLGLDNVTLVNKVEGLTVLADSLLQQLFYNLMDDSLKHGEKVSQIQVYYQEQKNHLKLVYEDNGIGIPDDEKELIFKEGYGKGTGYGLYLIKKICEAYGWTIKEVGKHGHGAKFVMTIPTPRKGCRPLFQIDQ